MTRAAVTLALLAMLAPGCSWVFVESVPHGHPPKLMPKCTAHRGTVVIDAAYASMFGLFALLFTAIEDSSDGDNVAAALAVPAAVFAGSAFVGIDRTTRCRDARSMHEQWLMHHRGNARPAPVPTGPPGAPPALPGRQ